LFGLYLSNSLQGIVPQIIANNNQFNLNFKQACIIGFDVILCLVSEVVVIYFSAASIIYYI